MEVRRIILYYANFDRRIRKCGKNEGGKLGRK
jgi:hypothetical protein